MTTLPWKENHSGRHLHLENSPILPILDSWLETSPWLCIILPLTVYKHFIVRVQGVHSWIHVLFPIFAESANTDTCHVSSTGKQATPTSTPTQLMVYVRGGLIQDQLSALAAQEQRVGIERHGARAHHHASEIHVDRFQSKRKRYWARKFNTTQSLTNWA